MTLSLKRAISNKKKKIYYFMIDKDVDRDINFLFYVYRYDTILF